MADSRDQKYLELHGNQYRVTYGVPADVQPELGKRLKRSLHTDSLTKANRMKWPVIREFQALIEKTRGIKAGERWALMQEAAEVAKERIGMSEEAEASLNNDLMMRSYEILGAPSGYEVDSEGDTFEIHPKEKLDLSRDYQRVASGAMLPLRLEYDEYVEKVLKRDKKLKPRTIDDDKRAIETFERWCRKQGIPEDLRSITTKVAKNFAEDLGTFEGTLEPITCAKYVTRLRQYWERLTYLEIVSANPWLAVRVRVPETAHEQEERAFTDDEVRRLLTGTCTAHLKDLMFIAALTGARIDAFVDLRVRNVLDGYFTFKPQKREKSARDVPVHSALKDIVARRIAGKNSEDWFFPEFPPPTKKDSLKEHSSQATKAFTNYRRRIGVDEVVDGKRRSLVNFHSFRRWFVTKAERADQKETIVAAVVGHKRAGITLSKYSEGPEMRQARRCVEAVRLPALGDEPVKEPQAITPRRRAA